jgi:uncharacterized membrane protein YhiD involved in acid resistance
VDLFNKLLLDNYVQSNVDIINNIVLSIALSFVLGIVIMLVHKKNSTNMVYEPQINFSLLFLTMIMTFVMIVIGSNLALSLGLIGALSIIRFRTAIKNTIDISFIFWAIATGLALGSFNYFLAIFEVVTISIIIIIASKYFLVNKPNNEYVIVLQLDIKSKNTQIVDNKLSSMTDKYEVKSYVKLDNFYEYSVFVRFEDENNLSKIMHELQMIKNVKHVSILYPNTNLYI